jgi:hypothetical protein
MQSPGHRPTHHRRPGWRVELTYAPTSGSDFSMCLKDLYEFRYDRYVFIRASCWAPAETVWAPDVGSRHANPFVLPKTTANLPSFTPSFSHATSRPGMHPEGDPIDGVLHVVRSPDAGSRGPDTSAPVRTKKLNPRAAYTDFERVRNCLLTCVGGFLPTARIARLSYGLLPKLDGCYDCPRRVPHPPVQDESCGPLRRDPCKRYVVGAGCRA